MRLLIGFALGYVLATIYRAKNPPANPYDFYWGQESWKKQDNLGYLKNAPTS